MLASSNAPSHLFKSRHLQRVARGLLKLAHGDVELKAEFIARGAILLLVDIVQHQHAKLVAARLLNNLNCFLKRLVGPDLRIEGTPEEDMKPLDEASNMKT